MQTSGIDDRFSEIARYKGVLDREKYLTFAFEYAFLVAKYNGYIPVDSYISYVIENRLEKIAQELERTYNRGRKSLKKLHVPALSCADVFARQDYHKFQWGLLTK